MEVKHPLLFLFISVKQILTEFSIYSIIFRLKKESDILNKTNKYIETENAIKENKEKIKLLKFQIKDLKKTCGNFVSEEIKNKKQEIKILIERNNVLTGRLNYYKRSKYGGEYFANGRMFALFGKRNKDLTVEEKRLYNKIKKAESRAKNEKNEDQN